MGRPAKYPEEFRRDAVELCRTSGRSIADVARSLGINDSTLHHWLKADRKARQRAEDPDALSESEREELARLRRENRELRAPTKRSCVRRPPISPGRRCGEPLPLRRGSPGRL